MLHILFILEITQLLSPTCLIFASAYNSRMYCANDEISRHGALHRNHSICFPWVLSIRHSFKNTDRISFQLKTDSTFYVRNQVEAEWVTHTHYIKISMTALKASTYWVNCRKYEFLFGFLWVSHMKYPVSFYATQH